MIDPTGNARITGAFGTLSDWRRSQGMGWHTGRDSAVAEGTRLHCPTEGRFLLTGSANLLLMRQVSESLAGRASYLTLWPMTRREQRGEGRAGRWEELLAAPDEEWLDLLAAEPAEPEDWRALCRRGGFPKIGRAHV